MNATSIVLAISLLANAALGWSYLGQRDTAVVQTEKTNQATGAATACSAGVESLQTKAATRKAQAAPKIEAAQKDAEENNKRADVILSTPSAVPGDDCKSAQARVETWWNERGQK